MISFSIFYFYLLPCSHFLSTLNDLKLFFSDSLLLSHFVSHSICLGEKKKKQFLSIECVYFGRRGRGAKEIESTLLSLSCVVTTHYWIVYCVKSFYCIRQNMSLYEMKKTLIENRNSNHSKWIVSCSISYKQQPIFCSCLSKRRTKKKWTTFALSKIK